MEFDTHYFAAVSQLRRESILCMDAETVICLLQHNDCGVKTRAPWLTSDNEQIPPKGVSTYHGLVREVLTRQRLVDSALSSGELDLAIILFMVKLGTVLSTCRVELTANPHASMH